MRICVRSLKAYTDSIDDNRRTMNVVAVANEGRAALLMLIRSVMKYKQSCPKDCWYWNTNWAAVLMFSAIGKTRKGSLGNIPQSVTVR